MNLTKYAVLSSLLIMLPCLIVAQQSREEGQKAIEAKLLDVPSGTYKLNATYNGRGYQFCNTSAVRVVRIRLGCVEKKNGALKILNERHFEDVDLSPANENEVSCWVKDSNHGYFPGQPCKKGKLAVVEVEFADGTPWKLRPQPGD